MSMTIEQVVEQLTEEIKDLQKRVYALEDKLTDEELDDEELEG